MFCTGDHSLPLKCARCEKHVCAVGTLTTLRCTIVIGYERVLQNNFIPRLVHSLRQLQGLLTVAQHVP